MKGQNVSSFVRSSGESSAKAGALNFESAGCWFDGVDINPMSAFVVNIACFDFVVRALTRNACDEPKFSISVLAGDY